MSIDQVQFALKIGILLLKTYLTEERYCVPLDTKLILFSKLDCKDVSYQASNKTLKV